MAYISKPKALILLADGTIFYGKSIGISGVTFGEICFNNFLVAIVCYYGNL
jgi:carbamoyl-phosphate synthase small subunit